MRNVLGTVLASLVSVTGGCLASGGPDDPESLSLGLVGFDPAVELRIHEGPEDRAFAVTTDSAGNAYVAGAIDNPATCRFGVVKYDSQGSRVWTAFHSGSLGNAFGQARAVAVDRSGNVFVAGTVRTVTSTAFSGTALLVKLSPTGVELWAKAIDAIVSPVALAIDSGGNVVTGGGSNGFPSDIVTQKYSSSGALIWSRTFSGTRSMSTDGLSGLALDRADNVVIAGSTQSTGSVNEAFDVVTIKYDPVGNMLWSRVFGRTPETQEQGQDIAIDENGGVYVVAATWPDTMIEIGELATPALIKYDANGNQQFAQVGEGFGGRAVVADGRGRVYAMGEFPAHVSAFDLNGTRLWTTSVGAAKDLAVTPAGDIIVGGGVSSQLDRNGAMIGQHTLSSLHAVDVEVDAFGSAYVTGNQLVGTSGFIALQDIVTLKLATGGSGNPPTSPPTSPPVTIPAAPTSLAAVAPSRASVSLRWGDNANNEQGVRVERCTGSRCTSFVRIADTAANAVSFVDSSVRSSTTYRYRVRAFNSAGSSAFSNIVSVRTPFR